MSKINKITENKSTKSPEEVESFINEIFGCDAKELYSLILCASWCFKDMFDETKQEKYLRKSKQLKEIYVRLFPNVIKP